MVFEIFPLLVLHSNLKFLRIPLSDFAGGGCQDTRITDPDIGVNLIIVGDSDGGPSPVITMVTIVGPGPPPVNGVTVTL